MVTVGAFAGLIAGLLGVGGGIVIVPALYIVLTAVNIDELIRMHVAVGTSLAIIIPTSIISARSHYKRGSVDVPLLKQWGPPLLGGVVVGAFVASLVSGLVLSAIFATIAILVSANMLRGDKGWRAGEALPGQPARGAIAAFIGMISTMMGIGGGTLSVPILTAYSWPIRRAVGTAAAIGVIIAIPGATGFLISGLGADGRPPFTVGYINLIGVALIVPTTMLLAPYGAKLAHTMAPGRLQAAFAIFLGLTALRMWYDVATAMM
jgi:uncharacterized membrane protein YfcA